MTGKMPYKNKMMVMAALFVALSYVATVVLMIPSPTGGYMNLGDTVVLLGAYLLGPAWGAVAGGLGPALADLLGGYGVYAPATLVIKALMAVSAALVYRVLGRKNWVLLISGCIAEAIMVVGYCLFDAFLAGNLAVGLTGIPANLMQAAFGLVASTLLTVALKKNVQVCRAFPRL